MKTFIRTAAELNALEMQRPPAEIRQAVRPIAALAAECANEYRSSIIHIEKWLAGHEELVNRRKENPKWVTLEVMCHEVYGVSPQAVNKKFREYSEKVLIGKPGFRTLNQMANEEAKLNTQNAPSQPTQPAPPVPAATASNPAACATHQSNQPAPKQCAVSIPATGHQPATPAKAEPKYIEVEEECSCCNGSGKEECHKCDGAGKVKKKKQVELTEPQLQLLWGVGVKEPEKLTAGFGKRVIGRIRTNGGKLPTDLDYLRNTGEYEEKKWKGAPAK